MKNEQYLKINQAANMIVVSPWTIRKWIKERRLPFYRFGGTIRIKEKDLIGFAERIESINNFPN